MLGRLALVVGSVLFTLGALEIGGRLWRSPESLLDWSNIVLEDRRATRAAGVGRLKYDAELGFVPAQGYRPTPASEGLALAEPPILVVGDSYAHGDEVSDGETWAALLQSLTHRRTVNAGVSGYGLDQIVLRAEALASCRTLLKDAGYAVEDDWQDGEAGTPVTLLAHHAAVSAGGLFYLEVSAVTHDSVVEYLTNRPPLPEESVALPTPTVALAVASPSPASDPGYSSIRTRLACAADRVIVSFHSPARVRQDELEAAGQLGWHLHSLRGICPQIPALRSGASTQNPLVVLEIEGLPIPLMNCDPAQLVWPEVFHDVLELLSALLKRGWHLNGLRPGWFVHTPQGLRLCSLNSLAREETEDALSALWWFFHDLASGGPRWREWPVPPPEGDLPVLIPAEIRQKITTLLEGETLSDALASLDTH